MIIYTHLFYVHPGKEGLFEEYESLVLPLLARHGGELLLRLKVAPESVTSAEIDVPTELHIVRFPDEAALEGYGADEERRKHADLRNQALRTVLSLKGAAV